MFNKFHFFLISVSISFFISTCIANPSNTSPELVLDYWFGNLKSSEDYPKEKNKMWFMGGPEVDLTIRSRFENLLMKAKNRELDNWKNCARGRLALIILVDQFPRNMYRGTPDAFSFDDLAQEFALEGILNGDDLKLFPIERVFFYLPLEHSENLDLQMLSVEKFTTLLADSSDSLKSVFESFLDYSQRHYDVISQFGRFPHRNSILGRQSTVEESLFLEMPKSSF